MHGNGNIPIQNNHVRSLVAALTRRMNSQYNRGLRTGTVCSTANSIRMEVLRLSKWISTVNYTKASGICKPVRRIQAL